MKEDKDITGKRFGRLVVICPTERRISGNVVWKCQCDCGNIAYVRRNSLTSNHAKSCGCLRRESTGKQGLSNAKNLTGQRFGMAVALRPTEQRKKRTIVWECQCDCGKIFYASSGELSSGKVKSCGCVK